MSDQVVFTKEEVEKIKNALHKHELTDNGHYWNDVKDALSLLDSPRHRPKVSLHILEACSTHDYEELDHWKPRAKLQADLFGFDVED